ncbi:MAG: PDZ domain-containing protein [Planctomycetota bacterium]|nr:PDZ domain-containing protein [Planctomycetota bacterium]
MKSMNEMGRFGWSSRVALGTTALVLAAGLAGAVAPTSGVSGHAGGCPAACPEGSSKTESSLDVLSAIAPQIAPVAQRQVSVITMTESDGDNTYTVEIRGDQVTASVNGEPVPEDRIRRTREGVQLLDQNGDVMKSFRMQGTWLERDAERPRAQAQQERAQQDRVQEERAQGFRRMGDARRRAAEERQRAEEVEQRARAQGDLATPPPVMLGITMGDVDAGLLEFLGIREGSAFRVQTVVEDLPADEAGLEAGDIVIGINGKEGASTLGLREILLKSKPGDKITLRVIRRGQEPRNVTVTLAPFDAAKLPMAPQAMVTPGVPGVPMVPGVPGVPGAPQPPLPPEVRFFGDDLDEQGGKWDEVKDQLRRALERVRAEFRDEGGKLKEEVTKALSDALAALEDNRDELRSRLFNFLDPQNSQRNFRFRMSPEGQVFVPQEDGQLSERVDRLNERLDKMESRLDEIRELLREQRQRGQE